MLVKNSAEVNELTAEMLKKAAVLDDDQKRALARKWRLNAKGHRKNASYYSKQGQFTYKRQESELAVCYDRVAEALETVLEQEDNEGNG